MRRRKIDTENLGENTPISLRLPKKILDWIQEVCDNNPELYTGRNHFIEEACRYYLNCAPCANCGNLNHRDAFSCSYCEDRLPAFQDLLESFNYIVCNYENLLKDGFEIFSQYHLIVNEIKKIIEELPGELKTHLEEEFKRHLSICDEFSVSSLIFYDTYQDLAPGFADSDLYKENFSNISTLENDLIKYHLSNLPQEEPPEKYSAIKHLAAYHACKKLLSEDPVNHLTSEYTTLQDFLLNSILAHIHRYNERLLLACEELNVFKRLLLILKDSKKE